MEYKDLIGKTIKSISQKKLKGYDDTGFLEITFTDNTRAIIVAYYGEHTGESIEEYPTGILVKSSVNYTLEDIPD